ncbi:MAG: hypothetical protein AAF390_10160 [Pseudomonadota bacterium]
MSFLQFVHALFLRLLGLVLVVGAAVGSVLPDFAAERGLTLVDPVADTTLVIAAVLGLFLFVPWWLPAGLRRPASAGDLMWISVLAGASWQGATIFLSVARTLELTVAGRPLVDPYLDHAWAAGAALTGLVVLLLVVRRPAQAPAEAPEDAFDLEPHMEAAAPPQGERFAALTLHRVLLAFGGVSMIVSGVAIHLAPQRDPALAAFYAAHDLGAYVTISATLCVVLGLTFLFTRTMPRAVHRPTRWFHFPAIGLYLILLSALAIAPLFGAVIPATFAELGTDFATFDPQAPGVVARFDLVQSGPTAQILGAVSFFGLILTTLMVIARPLDVPPVDAIPMSHHAAHAAQTRAASGPKPKAPRRKANPALPAIGAAMKLYQAADWLVLRLLGLALLGTAYMMWQVMQSGSTILIGTLAQGLAPTTALYIYAGLGAFLALPFVMPRFLAAPSHVLGGLGKSLLLVVAALILIEPLNAAITLYTPDIYHATLQATAPRAFKAVAGIAVTSALLISFFRQLGGTTKVDYQGRPVHLYSQSELADIRRARMYQASPDH